MEFVPRSSKIQQIKDDRISWLAAAVWSSRPAQSRWSARAAPSGWSARAAAVELERRKACAIGEECEANAAGVERRRLGGALGEAGAVLVYGEGRRRGMDLLVER
jgi:hypothetical protein